MRLPRISVARRAFVWFVLTPAVYQWVLFLFLFYFLRLFCFIFPPFWPFFTLAMSNMGLFLFTFFVIYSHYLFIRIL